MNLINVKNTPDTHDRFGSMINELFNRSFGSVFMNDSQLSKPTTNVVEKESEYILEIAAPGLEKEDFAIKLKDELLTIKVTNENQSSEESDNYALREFNFSSFERTFSVSEGIDVHNIKADYADGILSVHLPKKEEKAKLKGKKIEIS